LAAERLRALGAQPLLIDAGPRPRAETSIEEVDRRMWPFVVPGETYDWYRVRAVGGRAHLWGGWCYRFPHHVLRRGGWPFPPSALDQSYQTAEELLHLRTGRLSTRFGELATELGLSIVPKTGARMPNDDVWTPTHLASARGARTHNVALSFEHSSGRADVLRCLDLRQERVVRVRARSFVLAASPIESARILMCSELGQHGQRIGRGLVDHMVASYVLLEPKPPPREPDSLARSALVESFVNNDEASQRSYPGGFSIELSGPVPLAALNMELMVPGSELGGWSATQIHAMGECFAHPQRYLDLDASETDISGRPLPRIHMAWSDAERVMAEDMKQACTNLADALAVPGSKFLKFADPLTAGSGHEAGTCAMGVEAPAPCTPEGQVRALQNVWVADAATMPTSGDRHPTLTILAQAMRAADACHRAL